jgi:hypothetical protein
MWVEKERIILPLHMPNENKIPVRLRVLNIEYNKENKTLHYNLEVCKEQTFEVLYNFQITISKNSIDRTNLKCSLSVLDQIKEKIAIFDNYLQGALIYDHECILINLCNLKPYAWTDLNLGEQDES